MFAVRCACLTGRTDSVNGSAVNVLTGQARPVVDSNGVPPSQGIAGSNKWISKGLPAAISFKLAKPAPIAQVSGVLQYHVSGRLRCLLDRVG